MSAVTGIEWTDATVNAVNGCSVVSPGCTNCYAMRAGSRGLPNHPSAGLTAPSKAGHVWTGEVRLNERALLQPLRWKRPRRIFWNAHGDLFHDSVPDEWIDRCFAVMALTPQHIHQVLTKRPERMREYLTTRKGNRPLSIAIGDGTLTDHPWNNQLKVPQNIWLGTSVEDQPRANERIPHLLATPAALRFLSGEPLLGPIWPWHELILARANALVGRPANAVMPGIDWIIVGGESGPGARPMQPGWARMLRNQCAAVGVPFFFKQWGAWTPLDKARGADTLYLTTKANAGRLLDGVTHDGMPA
jgi:protein gp37